MGQAAERLETEIKEAGVFQASLLPAEIQRSLVDEIRRKMAEVMAEEAEVLHARVSLRRRFRQVLGLGKVNPKQDERTIYLIRWIKYAKGTVNTPFWFSKERKDVPGETYAEGPFDPGTACVMAFLYHEAIALASTFNVPDLAQILEVDSVRSFGEGGIYLLNQFSLEAIKHPREPMGEVVKWTQREVYSSLQVDLARVSRLWTENLYHHGQEFPGTRQYLGERQVIEDKLLGLKHISDLMVEVRSYSGFGDFVSLNV